MAYTITTLGFKDNQIFSLDGTNQYLVFNDASSSLSKEPDFKATCRYCTTTVHEKKTNCPNCGGPF